MNSLAVICGLAVICAVVATPLERVRRQDGELSVADKLGLPSNATAIRENIVDTFSCDGKVYGYYADVDNECQLFHICYPVQLADGTSTTFKWSFICPAETIFNQESFTCTYPTDAIPCSEAPSLYNLNNNFGVIPEKTAE